MDSFTKYDRIPREDGTNKYKLIDTEQNPNTKKGNKEHGAHPEKQMIDETSDETSKGNKRKVKKYKNL